MITLRITTQPNDDGTACKKCQHFACVCAVLFLHDVRCPFRTAVACAVAVECEHGRDICPQCDPCTCGVTA